MGNPTVYTGTAGEGGIYHFIGDEDTPGVDKGEDTGLLTLSEGICQILFPAPDLQQMACYHVVEYETGLGLLFTMFSCQAKFSIIITINGVDINLSNEQVDVKAST